MRGIHILSQLLYSRKAYIIECKLPNAICIHIKFLIKVFIDPDILPKRRNEMARQIFNFATGLISPGSVIRVDWSRQTPSHKYGDIVNIDMQTIIRLDFNR